VPIVVVLPFYFTLKAAYTDPGIINPSNVQDAIAQYPYDEILFRPNVCRTCVLTKPARSKHCSICHACIARNDHHCAWINNCVGQNNTGLFLLVLLSTGVLLSYGTYLAHNIMTDWLRSQAALGVQEARDWVAGGSTWAVWLNGWGQALTYNLRVGAVGLLCLLTQPMAWGFLLYHLYLVWAGTTTNETLKWVDWRHGVADGHVWMRERSGQVAGLGPMENSQEVAFANEWAKWPVKSTMVVTYEEDDTLFGGDRRWQQVRSMEELQNIYDIGFWKNLRLLLFPKVF
jgi:palmitoyltransferase ZDHHC4